jgi:hypothetical protein
MVCALVVAGALAFSGGASGAASLPTLTVTIKGAKSVSVSGSTVSGAVNVVGSGRGAFAIVRLDPGVAIQQAAGAVQSHHGDINALTPYGSLFVDAAAPGTVQTVLTPGNYVALNVTGNAPAFAPFTVSQSSAPAALPAAAATQTAIEFGFRGPTVLHAGTMVRAINGGWLVHMIDMFGVRNKATANQVMALLRAGKDRKAQRLVSGPFLTLLGPASPGAMQQSVLQAKPGVYVEACFMDTLDHREHTRLGMLRLVRVVK